jgi:purine-binding chemotaxis protein CheW
MLVVKTKSSTIGYIVDSVTRIIKLRAKAVLPPPELIQEGVSSPYIRGVCTVDEKLLVVLDFERMLSIDEDQELEQFWDKIHNHQH